MARANTTAAAAVFLTAALLVSSVGPAAHAAAPPTQGPDAAAEAAKKKKKKRKKKCRRTDQSPVFNALSCRALLRPIPSEPPVPNGSERWRFCRNGTYRYRLLAFDSDGSSLVTTYRGRWKVISSTEGSAGLSGAIQYTVTAFRSVTSDGSPGETAPPPLLSEAIAFGPFGVDFGGTTYLRGKAKC